MRVADAETRLRIKGIILSGVPTVPAFYERLPLLWLLNSALLMGKGRDTLHHFIMDKFDNETRKIMKDKSLPSNCFISTNRAVIDDFNSDLLCGQTVDLHIWKSIRSVMIGLMKPKKFFSDWADSPNKPPVLFICGKLDPVCKRGDTAKSDAIGMRKIGFNVDEVYLDNCLHEFMHEEDRIREKGIGECITWIRSKL
jgi:alpha-beta hydrolase superfamily lysophospholipase